MRLYGFAKNLISQVPQHIAFIEVCANSRKYRERERQRLSGKRRRKRDIERERDIQRETERKEGRGKSKLLQIDMRQGVILSKSVYQKLYFSQDLSGACHNVRGSRQAWVKVLYANKVNIRERLKLNNSIFGLEAHNLCTYQYKSSMSPVWFLGKAVLYLTWFLKI